MCKKPTTYYHNSPLTYRVPQSEEHLRPGHDLRHTIWPNLDQNPQDGAPGGGVGGAIQKPGNCERENVFFGTVRLAMDGRQK